MKYTLFIPFLLLISFRVMAQQVPMSFTQSDDSNTVILDKIEIKTNVIGKRANHTWTMIFKNNSKQAQEVNLVFPLPQHATITGYALDINGKMREAVPVEKHKATQVLEAIENRNIDPGLLEKTDGNVFKTRIFPVLSGKTRTIRIEYDDELQMNDGQLSMTLPFSYSKKVNQLDVSIRYLQSKYQPNIQHPLGNLISFKKEGQDYIGKVLMNNIAPSNPVLITVQHDVKATEVLTQNRKGSMYFMVNQFLQGEKRIKSKPSKIAILWDNSLSGLDRDIEKELKFLDDYIKHLQTVDINLTVFNQTIEKVQQYHIVEGDWSALQETLKHQIYDGGTQLGLLRLDQFNADEYLLFSDGHQTYFKDSIRFVNQKPVYTIASSALSDFPNLQFISNKSGGELINLMNQSIEESGDKIKYHPLKLIHVIGDASTSEIYPSIPTTIQQSITIVGKMNQAHSSIILQYGYGNEIVIQDTIKIDAKRFVGLNLQHSKSLPQTRNEMNKKIISTNDLEKLKSNFPEYQVARTWAEKKIDELDLQFNKNQEEIQLLGNEFGLVTRNTSFMVLENIEDYIRYEITPPAEMMAEFNQISKEEKTSLVSMKKDLVERTFKMNKELNVWWNGISTHKKTSHSLSHSQADSYTWSNDSVSVEAGTYTTQGAAAAVASPRANMIVRDASPQMAPPPPPVRPQVRFTPPVIRKAAEVKAEEAPPAPVHEFHVSSNSNSAPAAVQDIITYNKIRGEDEEAQSDTSAIFNSNDMTKVSGHSIEYITTLRNTPRENQYATYLELRKDYLKVPAFYYHIAAYFIGTDRKALGLKILTNLAELDFENYEVYKMMGYKLRQIGEHEAEVSVFKKVLDWRPDEPQSYRDYGLAMATMNRSKEALQQLRTALEKSYDENKNLAYEGIEEIILMDIKELIFKNPSLKISTDLQAELKRNLPVDIRVVLNWNMIDTDIDLWVTDPLKECCKYNHNSTKLGGRISNDFTDGLGPEQFLLKKAPKGKYKIEADYYGQTQVKIAGSTTVMAEIFTHFGTPQQEKKIVTFQLQEGANRTQLIGEFEL